MDTSSVIELRGIGLSSHCGCTETKILENVSLRITLREIVVLLGRNGGGKTSLLNIMMGLIKPTYGSRWFSPALNGSIGLVSQRYASTLLPWASVLDTIIMPLRLKGLSRQEAISKLEDLLDSMQLFNFPLNRRCHLLSGGEAQITAILRAVLMEPRLLVLDEPFSALDLCNRAAFRSALRCEFVRRSMTAVFVSHDLDDAVFLADKAVILSGTPTTVSTVHTIPLPKCRDGDLITSNVFAEARKNLWVTLTKATSSIP